MNKNSKNAVFISGGGRGIGRAIVLEFVRNGFDCAFTYVANKKAADETVALARDIRTDVQLQVYKLDVCNVQNVGEVVARVIDDFGNISAIVNNAAIVHDNLMATMSDEEWHTVINTNLTGPFYVIREFLFHLLSNRYGRIINISSLAQEGSSGQANYAASKGGLIALSLSLAREYGSKNITCNVVTPGVIETEMFHQNQGVNRRDDYVRFNPMKRLGSADEVASAVHYLTTPAAGFINGEVIRVSGGLTHVT